MDTQLIYLSVYFCHRPRLSAPHKLTQTSERAWKTSPSTPDDQTERIDSAGCDALLVTDTNRAAVQLSGSIDDVHPRLSHFKASNVVVRSPSQPMVCQQYRRYGRHPSNIGTKTLENSVTERGDTGCQHTPVRLQSSFTLIRGNSDQICPEKLNMPFPPNSSFWN